MQRFFCNQNDLSGLLNISDKKEMHHIRNVCRLKIGEKIELINGKGVLYRGSIQEIKKSAIIVKIENKQEFSSDIACKIILGCAIPKKAKMEDIIVKTTELGVDTIIPLKTERTIINFKGTKEVQAIKRWQDIALQACKQSQRVFLPTIEKIKTLKEAIAFVDCDIKLIPNLEGKRENIAQVLQKKSYHSVFILIGPEGDFSESEVSLAKENGFIPVSLGKLTLKVDTAAISAVVLAALLSKTNDD